jgi:hypothetical protein
LPDAVEYRCSTPTVCDRPVDLAPVLARQDPVLTDRFATVITALQTVIGKRPIEQRQFLGRSLLASPPAAVAVVAEDRIAPEDLLSGLPKGALLVRYRTISPDKGAGVFVTTVVTWSGGSVLPLALRRGLYEIRVSAPASAPGQAPAANDGLVLVVGPANYQRARSLLLLGEDYLASLNGLGPSERSALLRYLLMSLASD